MSHNNDSGKFFKFKNLQLVRKPNTVRQTRQNTDLRTHGTAEEQFAAITATAGTPCQTLEYDRQCPTITIAENSLSLKTYN